MMKVSYNDAKLIIKNSLRRGKDYAISRQRLKQLTGLDDRSNRDIIKDLRLEGMLIMSSSSEKGYWLAETQEEAESFIKENRHRSRECGKIATACETHMHEQLEIEQ